MSPPSLPSRLRAALPRAVLLLGAFLSFALSLRAQDDGPRVRYILSIGDYPRVDGVRLNYRDTEFDLVRGANITIWTPYEGDWRGTVKGLALGLPSTGAETIQGLGVGVVGVAASQDLTGIALGGIGVGAGDGVSGIAIGGIGVGGGGDVNGLAVGGIGVGSGGSATGILVGGIGAGVGGDIRYVALGGIGVGAGGNATGLLIGGVGAGVGGDIDGIAIGGVGVGAGGTLRGLFLGGVGVGAPRIVGIAIGSMVGAEELRGFAFAPIQFRSAVGGEVTGATVSLSNYVRGDVRGVSLGLVNYAWSVDGFQLGVVNVIRDNPRGRRVLPVINW